MVPAAHGGCLPSPELLMAELCIFIASGSQLALLAGTDTWFLPIMSIIVKLAESSLAEASAA